MSEDWRSPLPGIGFNIVVQFPATGPVWLRLSGLEAMTLYIHHVRERTVRMLMSGPYCFETVITMSTQLLCWLWSVIQGNPVEFRPTAWHSSKPSWFLMVVHCAGLQCSIDGYQDHPHFVMRLWLAQDLQPRHLAKAILRISWPLLFTQ